MDKNNINDHIGPEPGDAMNCDCWRCRTKRVSACTCNACKGLKPKRLAVTDGPDAVEPIIVEASPEFVPPPLVHKNPYIRVKDKPMITMTQYRFDHALSAKERFGYITGILVGVCGSVVSGALMWWASS